MTEAKRTALILALALGATPAASQDSSIGILGMSVDEMLSSGSEFHENSRDAAPSLAPLEEVSGEDGNTVSSFIEGSGNNIQIIQSGRSNRARAVLSGSHNEAMILQSGTGNTASVRISGARNTVSIRQNTQ